MNRRKSNRWLASLLAGSVLVLMTGCGSSGPDSAGDRPSGKADWTYMVYIAGDNNLSEAAAIDLNEMEAVGSDDNINIVVQAEFSSRYMAGAPDQTLRARIAADDDPDVINTPLTPIGNVDMGAKETLTDFITWATSTYPADNYALVLWDHGAGWKVARRSGGAIRGALQDETSGSFMSLPDIAEAVNTAGVHLRLLNFDACLMAMHEVAYQFNGLAEYLVASEETEPGEGDPYHTILAHLKASPNMTGLQLARTIVEDFAAYYRQAYPAGGPRPVSITKSVIDLGQIATLQSHLTDLAQTLIGKMDTERAAIQAARDASIAYEYPTNRDLGDFLDRLAANTSDLTLGTKIAAVKATLTSAVKANATYSTASSTNVTDSQGLAIFLPRRNQVTDQELAEYALLASSTGAQGWSGFISKLITGDEGQTALEKVPGNFAFWLTWDTAADLDLLVNEPDGTWAAPFIGSTTPNGFLSADSSVSGEPAEYYVAAETVQKGVYDVYVNYWDHNGVTGPTKATLYYYDAEDPASSEFIEVGSRTMDLSNPAPENWASDDYEFALVWQDAYSDWWVPGSLERTQATLPIDTVTPGGKTIRLHLIPNKAKRERLPTIETKADLAARRKIGVPQP